MPITQKEYLEFLDKISYPLPKIKEIEILKFKTFLSEADYPKLSSDRQILTIMEIIHKVKFIYYRYPSYNIKTRLLDILTKKHPGYKSFVYLEKVLDNLLENKTSDLKFYNTIKENLYKIVKSDKSKNLYPFKLFDPRDNFSQSLYFDFFLSYVKNTHIKNYLDIGAGDGFKTYYLSKKIGLEKENVVGLDFTNFGSVDYLEKRHKGITFVDHQGGKYPFKNSSFDLVSAFMVAHHVKDLDSFFKEIYRIVRKGKYFILAEHNNVTFVDNILTDIEHAMYETVYKKGKVNLKYLKEEYTKYYDWVEWSIMLEKHGFKLIKHFDYSHNLASTIPSTVTFYALYKKV